MLKRQQAQHEPIYQATTLQSSPSGSGVGSLDHLPRTQRLKVCKKLRQEQLKRYYEQEKADYDKGELNRAFSCDVMLSSNMAASIATEIDIHKKMQASVLIVRNGFSMNFSIRGSSV